MRSLNVLWDTAELPLIAKTRDRAARVDWRMWRTRLARLVRRLPLLLAMVLPFLLGWSARLVVRALFRVVWALGWLASWLFYTAQEGWYAGAGRSGPG